MTHYPNNVIPLFPVTDEDEPFTEREEALIDEMASWKNKVDAANKLILAYLELLRCASTVVEEALWQDMPQHDAKIPRKEAALPRMKSLMDLQRATRVANNAVAPYKIVKQTT